MTIPTKWGHHPKARLSLSLFLNWISTHRTTNTPVGTENCMALKKIHRRLLSVQRIITTIALASASSSLGFYIRILSRRRRGCSKNRFLICFNFEFEWMRDFGEEMEDWLYGGRRFGLVVQSDDEENGDNFDGDGREDDVLVMRATKKGSMMMMRVGVDGRCPMGLGYF
ncbi:hypothetical protein V6N11_054298 [Hibiscus sabdariffa]|uniref:Transmembrane protein n=1 Tax=Hibiscus sabdariffa TaxID=183260 RepID=A0ABR2S3Y0_9ROSI